MQTSESLVQDILERGYITEKEINLLKKRMNASKDDSKDWFWFNQSLIWDASIEVTPEQGDKGYQWLMNLWRSAKGKERKQNPFGYREQETLENFSRFTFVGFYDIGNAHFSYYSPIYRVHATDGDWFQYHVDGGKIVITN